MKQRKTWVATFDEASCRVFSFNGVPRRLEELADQHRSGPRKPHFADRLGRVHASVGERRSGMAPRTDPERRLEVKFVESLAAELDAKAKTGAFDQLIVAASPRALGAFRAVASKPLMARVVREIRGDYVNSDSTRLYEAIDQ